MQGGIKMTIFKQIHMKFWQNDFVLGLTAEERYFYIYLITNSMTNQCGIFKFNRRLAELETGYSADEIERYLETFEVHGKVIISETTTEIMLVNWFKHNFKNNKKSILLINKELKDVKDKALLKKLYDSCSDRQYPVADIFNGIIITGIEKGVEGHPVATISGAALEIQDNINIDDVQERESPDLSIPGVQSLPSKEKAEADILVFSKIMKDIEHKEDEVKDDCLEEETCVIEDYLEEDIEETLEGTSIAFWSFTKEEEPQENKEGIQGG
jgi:hypothetical protein